MHLSKYLLGLAIAVAAQFAVALPLSAVGSSGIPGGPAKATLKAATDDGFDTLSFSFTFVSADLTFVGVSAGTEANWFDIVVDQDLNGSPVTVGMALYMGPVSSAPVSLVELSFLIKSTAAPALGYTDVVFSCLDFSVPGAQVGCVDYPFDSAFARIFIEQEPTPMPLPGTLPLALLGLAGVAVLRRKA